MKKTILILSIMTLTMQVHSEDFRLPKVNNFQKVPEFPVIRMPIDFTIPKKVGTFQGKLYAKKVGKRLRNIKTHNTRVFRGGHSYSYSLDIKVPKRKLNRGIQGLDKLKDKLSPVNVPDIKLYCFIKGINDDKTSADITSFTSFSKSLKLDSKEAKGTFTLFVEYEFPPTVKNGDSSFRRYPVSKALTCRVSLKENKGKKSEYDYVKYSLSFFDHGREK